MELAGEGWIQDPARQTDDLGQTILGSGPRSAAVAGSRPGAAVGSRRKYLRVLGLLAGPAAKSGCHHGSDVPARHADRFL